MTRLLPLLTAATLVGCGDERPTVTNPLTPVDPVTFEVRLPWSQFASDPRVISGFGRPIQTDAGLLAHEYGGELEARTLLRIGEFPRSVSVRDSLGTTRTDTTLTFISGALILSFDTVSATTSSVTSLRIDRVLEPFDARTATWDLAIDSGGVEVPWSQPGGGSVELMRQASWFPDTGGDLLVQLNAEQIALLGDTTRTDRGLLVSMETSGERLDVREVLLQLHTVPSVQPDSTLFLLVEPTQLTYLYSPDPPPVDTGFRVGGTPAWRSLLTLGLPATVPGTPAVCARITCPVALTPERVNHASLLFTTGPSALPFAPSDVMRVEVRGVVAPEYLPKSPLTGPLFLDTLGLPAGTTLLPDGFRAGSPRTVELPITPLVRTLLAGSALGAFRATPTVALMELLEPTSFPFASFVGPGGPGEPTLRLVLTISEPLGLP